MRIRPVEPRDCDAWTALRCALWPEEDAGDLRNEARAILRGDDPWRQSMLVCADGDGLIGMIELSERAYAEGCETSPVAFVEGWFVTPARRGQGVGRALMTAAEDWARARGHREMASDTQLWNAASQAAHARLGFEEVERVVAFRKTLAPPIRRP